MANFTTFSKPVYAAYAALAKQELYVTTATGDELWEHYLKSFPEGTDPIYREATEHTCSCCHNFVKNLGGVVGLTSEGVTTIWDGKGADYPYDVVAASMDAFLKSKSLEGLFRTSEKSYGAEHTFETIPGEAPKKWNHFHGEVQARHLTTTPDKSRGDFNTAKDLLERGLQELNLKALDEVLDLINTKALYRGEEHKLALEAFRTAKLAYNCLPEVQKAQFLLQNAEKPFSRFKNTVVGTLVEDLSGGKDLEQAVKSFEAKVAPANYKRPTALVTAGMVQKALETIHDLGLEPALERRFAKISDVTVNNVLWVAEASRAKMKGGLESLLMASVKPTNLKDAVAEDITMADFMQNVAPKATSIEALFKNAAARNLVSLTAPVHDDAELLFKWNSPFAWSYAGNIADSDMRQQVVARGGSVTGVFRFTHQWNHTGRNASLMDLHVFMPGNDTPADGIHEKYGLSERVGWNLRKHYESGGVQDVDYNSPAPEGYVPVENITFPNIARMKDGVYICKIHNWKSRTPTTSGFKAEIEFGGQVFEYEYTTPLKHHQWVTVAEVTKKGDSFSIEHKLPCGQSTKEVWGVNTESSVPVTTIMHSPNHWDGEQTGNKHWFFMLEGCKNPEPARGIYNEFLRPELEKHRKVFEMLGSKTKCQPTEDQLSGLGFSTTNTSNLTVKVTEGKRVKHYNIGM